jgi:hypothetical protein
VFRSDNTIRLLPGLLLAALLVGAQGALALHAFEHEPGTPQGKVCTTCVTATQLDAGSVDILTGDAPEPVRHVIIPTASRGFGSVHTATVRQRGPPSSS